MSLVEQFKFKTLFLLLLLSSLLLIFHNFFSQLLLLTFPTIYFYYSQMILHFCNLWCKSFLILASVRLSRKVSSEKYLFQCVSDFLIMFLQTKDAKFNYLKHTYVCIHACGVE